MIIEHHPLCGGVTVEKGAALTTEDEIRAIVHEAASDECDLLNEREELAVAALMRLVELIQAECFSQDDVEEMIAERRERREVCGEPKMRLSYRELCEMCDPYGGE